MVEKTDVMKPERHSAECPGERRGSVVVCPSDRDDNELTAGSPAGARPRIFQHSAAAESSGDTEATRASHREPSSKTDRFGEGSPASIRERDRLADRDRHLTEMTDTCQRLAHTLLDLRDRLRPASLAVSAINTLRRPSRIRHGGPREESSLDLPCKNSWKMAREHPMRSSLAGLGMGLILAFGLGKWFGGTDDVDGTCEKASAIPDSDTPLRSRSGMHGGHHLKSGPVGTSGIALSLTLGGVALIACGLLLSGRSEVKK